MNQAEKLNKDLFNTNFTKSYWWVFHIASNKADIGIINIILSFQMAGKDFFMQSEEIAKLIKVSPNYVDKRIKKMKDDGILDVDTQSNRNFAGKFRKITVDFNVVQNLLQPQEDYSFHNEDDCQEEEDAAPQVDRKDVKEDNGAASTPSTEPRKPEITPEPVEEEQEYEVKYTGFKVVELLKHYLGDDDKFIQEINTKYRFYMVKNQITSNSLESLALFLGYHIEKTEKVLNLIPSILGDIKRLKPELINAA